MKFRQLFLTTFFTVMAPAALASSFANPGDYPPETIVDSNDYPPLSEPAIDHSSDYPPLSEHTNDWKTPGLTAQNNVLTAPSRLITPSMPIVPRTQPLGVTPYLVPYSQGYTGAYANPYAAPVPNPYGYAAPVPSPYAYAAPAPNPYGYAPPAPYPGVLANRYPTYPAYPSGRQYAYGNSYGRSMPYRGYATRQNDSFPFSGGAMPFFNNGGNNTFGGFPTNPMKDMFGDNNSGTMPFFKQSKKTRKKAWGDERNIWPDFYTDFTDESWDTVSSGPRDLGEMPGGWHFPLISTPDPVTVSDAVANQVPPFAEEAGNMVDLSKWGIFDNKK